MHIIELRFRPYIVILNHAATPTAEFVKTMLSLKFHEKSVAEFCITLQRLYHNTVLGIGYPLIRNATIVNNVAASRIVQTIWN